MKITIYTITECAFSKQEKEYLSSHGLQFEEKNLEVNREFLTEMLAVGNNFAGTPVTKIEKDDGQIVILKGFTAAEFDKTLALAPQTVESVKQQVEVGQSQSEQAQPVAPPVPVVEVVPPTEVPPVVQPVAPVAPVTDPAMASVLNTLEQKAEPTTPPVEVPPAAPPAAPAAPAPIPSAPTIPDPQF
jgi:glutaredoxin